MITQERLIELFEYSPKWGLFTRRSDGKIMKSVNQSGFISIHVDNFLYTGHRLAWLYVHGKFPSGHLIHRDGDRTNNAIDNLVGSGSPEAVAKKQQDRLNKKIAREMKMNEPEVENADLDRRYENRLSKFIGAGYKPEGNHLVRQTGDGEYSYIVMYERYIRSLFTPL
jgi:hypothetical protein